MSILVLSALVPLLTIVALAFIVHFLLFSRGAGPRRWFRLRYLRRLREERLMRAAAARDRS